MKRKARGIFILALALALAMPADLAGQVKKGKLFRNRHKIENQELRSKIDSMTSVIDNTEKCAEYLVHCREVKIPILPPSVNSGEGRFTTEGDSIRYGMYAIKAIGRGVIDMIVRERTEGGPFTSIRDFITRTSGKEMNKRAIENLIKAGALDCLGGTRRQFMQIYAQIADQAAAESKAAVSGQLSLFDLMAPELRKEFEIRLPDVGEFGREQLLFFEKEVLGVYLSGHPLEEYEQVWRARITAVTSDFSLDEETGVSSLENEARVTVGGMITGITRKYTKNNKSMAFLMLEDLLGTVEVVVFPNSYEKYRDLITEDNKVFQGGLDRVPGRGGLAGLPAGL